MPKTPRPELARSIHLYISYHLETRGYPPSVEEIKQNTRAGSKSTVHRYLQYLEGMGYIKTAPPRKSRAIRLLVKPSAGLSYEEYGECSPWSG